MSESVESVEQRVTVEGAGDEEKLLAKPTVNPEDLAELVSGLPNQQKAEMVYELVLFAAMAAEETGHPVLNEFLAELEDMAAVYNDPARRRALGDTVKEEIAAARPSVIGEIGDAPQAVSPSARQTAA